MDVAVEIAIGYTLQVEMFVLPVLVLLSLLFPTFMPLVFTWPELISMVKRYLTIVITNDGDINWFEGAILLPAYLVMGIGVYFL
ncbi:hypothetical protein H8S33_14245 [Ornithinibacillus sp. BX22]|uniref:Uncharacterized protein n=1 Tax=Ornithinibacillus hominis TaxID=2763055 RepID=A0A923L7G7_9BACI|nr:hypothetical protein [Ornithinibacillus hominis]